MYQGKTTYQFLLSTLLLGFYLAFISIQVLFNFDTNSGNQACVSTVFPQLGNFKSVKGISAPGSSRHCLRLNKRFQPENIPAIEVTSTVCPILYLPIEDAFSYSACFIPAPYLQSQTLRGPPLSA